jgi:hypothetical protein
VPARDFGVIEGYIAIVEPPDQDHAGLCKECGLRGHKSLHPTVGGNFIIDLIDEPCAPCNAINTKQTVMLLLNKQNLQLHLS